MIDLWELLKNLFSSLLIDIVNDWLIDLQTAIGDLLQDAFFIEKTDGISVGFLSETTVNNAINVMYLTTLGLLTIKLCWKGYNVYVLWRDGEAETSPTTLLRNAVFALAVAMAFPVLYDIASNFAIWLTGNILGAFPGITSDNLMESIDSYVSSWWEGGLEISVFMIILLLIFLIVAIILCFQIVIMGIEMLIYRLGVPLAVIGLVDSDGGIWKSYLQLYFRQLATIIIRYFCLSMAVRCLAHINESSVIAGIMFLIAAFKMPKLLSSILSSGGGGGGGVVQTVVIAARTFFTKGA